MFHQLYLNFGFMYKMEKTNRNFIFKNHLITKLILKNLDPKSIKNCRLLCKNAADIGAQIFGNYRNPLYFTIYERHWRDQNIIDKHNNKKIKWLKAQLKQNPDCWMIKAMEIPIFDWKNNSNVYKFMKDNGHLLKDLRIVSKWLLDKDSKIYFDQVNNRKSTLLRHVLAHFCPNLKRLTIFDDKRNPEDNYYYEEELLPTELQLEYLSLVYDPVAYSNKDGDGFLLRMDECITKILKNCSNLKVLKLEPNSSKSNYLILLLRTMFQEQLALKSLEALSLGPKVNRKVLEFITENTFPSLITLQLRSNKIDKIIQQGLIDSPNTLKTLILSLKTTKGDDVKLEVANVLKCFPSVENIEISYFNESRKIKKLPLKVYASAKSFPKIKSFKTISRVKLKDLGSFLEAIFNIFPNLEDLSILALNNYGGQGDVNFEKLGMFEKLTQLNVKWFIYRDEECIVSKENLRAICPTLRKISLNGVWKEYENYCHILHPLDYTDIEED